MASHMLNGAKSIVRAGAHLISARFILFLHLLQTVPGIVPDSNPNPVCDEVSDPPDATDSIQSKDIDNTALISIR